MSRPRRAPTVYPILYTLPDAGAALGVAEGKVRELIDDKRLASVNFDGHLRVTHAALEEFVASLATPQRRSRLRSL
jgi:excisionase family DNA binding protein